MTDFDLEPLWLTFKLAAITTVLLFIITIPIAGWLSRTESKLRLPLQALANMPLVLPPSVLGFYLLLTFSPAYGLGRFLQNNFHMGMVFSFSGLVLGSIIFSFPFMLNPLLSGLENMPKSLTEASYVLGNGPIATFIQVLLPNLKPALLYGAALTFAHTLGEFGMVLMIGGKIPGKTRVASIAIYDEVESLNFSAANTYALILFVFSFALLMLIFTLQRKHLRLFR